jgi:hypothetical protein
MSQINLNNDDLEQQGKDFVNGRLYIYAAIANLFSGVYSFFILPKGYDNPSLYLNRLR